jgi:hypothetical protein
MLKLPHQPETMQCYYRSWISEDNGRSWNHCVCFGLLHPQNSAEESGYQRISNQIDKLKSLLSIYYTRCQMEIVYEHYSLPPHHEEDKENNRTDFKSHDSMLIFVIKNDLFRQEYQVVIPAAEAIGFINNQKIHEHYLFMVFEKMNQGIEADNQWVNFNQKEVLKNKLTEELLDTEQQSTEHTEYHSDYSGKFKI